MSDTIESIHAGRELIPRGDLSRCFKVATGHGVGPATLIHWRCRKNPIPYVGEERRILYRWAEVWEWYLIEFQGKRRKAA